MGAPLSLHIRDHCIIHHALNGCSIAETARALLIDWHTANTYNRIWEEEQPLAPCTQHGCYRNRLFDTAQLQLLEITLLEDDAKTLDEHVSAAPLQLEKRAMEKDPFLQARSLTIVSAFLWDQMVFIDESGVVSCAHGTAASAGMQCRCLTSRSFTGRMMNHFDGP